MHTHANTQTTDTFAALAEPHRQSIVELLAKHGQLSASNISGNFQISPAAISQHLKVLREADIIHAEKRAQQRIYQLNLDKINEIELWVKAMNALWQQRFNRLEAILEQNNHT